MRRLALYIALSAVVAAYAAVCLHSVQEIHYLKTFFPKQFTVQEAYYAAVIELIKVVIVGFPFLALIGISLFFLKK